MVREAVDENPFLPYVVWMDVQRPLAAHLHFQNVVVGFAKGDHRIAQLLLSVLSICFPNRSGCGLQH